MSATKTFSRSEFSLVGGLTPEETGAFDLRTIRTINWCTDTIDGNCNPLFGTWHQDTLGVSNGTLVKIATRYRSYENGSCEQKGWFGNQALAETLCEQSRLYPELINLIRSLRGKPPGVSVQLQFTRSATERVRGEDLRFLELFLQHPNYLRLLEAVAQEGYVELAFDAETSTWTATVSEPETPSLN